MFSKGFLKLSSFARKATKLTTKTNSIIKTVSKTNGPLMIRWMNNKSNLRSELPSLMKFEPQDTLFPSTIPSQISFFYKIFVDNVYNEDRFLDQAKQTVCKLSTHLANEDIEGIKSFLTKEAFEELSQNYKNLSSEQKSKLKIDINDILQCFPIGIRVTRISEKEYDVKIIVLVDVLNDSSNAANQKILSLIRTREFSGEPADFKMKILEPLLENKSFYVYEFHRVYGSELGTRNWMVSRLTHFKYKDNWKTHGLIH